MPESKLARAAVCFSDNIREREINKKIGRNRFCHQPKVKKFNNYCFKSVKGKFLVDKKKVDFSKINIKDRIRDYRKARKRMFLLAGNSYKTSNNINNLVNPHDYGLPLPVNKYSKIIGVFKYFKKPWLGIKTRKYEREDVIHYALQNFRWDFINDNIDNKTSVFPGDFRYNSNNMLDMCTVPFDEYSTEEILDGYFSRIGIDLCLPKFDEINMESILSASVNYKAKPGIISKQLVGTTRNVTTRYSKRVAFEYCCKIMNKVGDYVLDKSLYDYGGREKRVIIKENQSKPILKTRTIFMQEDVPTLIGQSLCKYIMHGLQHLDSGFNYGGRLNGRKNWIKFLNVMNCDKWFLINGNADFSGHDNNVTETKIVAACAMLRLSFPECEKIDRLFYYVMSSAIFKRIVLPESNLIYEIRKGLPSGHGLTSILTTVIAYGTFATAINNVSNRIASETENTYSHKKIWASNLVKDSFIYNAGDDVAYRVDSRFVKDIWEEINFRSGMKIDDLELTNGFFNSNSRTLRNTFLKKKYNNYKFSWNCDELFTNLLYPTMKSTSFGTLGNSLEQVIQSAPYDEDLNNLVKILYISIFLDRKFSNTKVHNKMEFINDNIRGSPKTSTRSVGSLSEAYRFIDYINENATLSNRNIDNVIFNFDYVYRYVYIKYSNEPVRINTRNEVKILIRRFNDIIKRKKRILSLHMPYISHRNVHRLSVFDLEKKYIPYNKYDGVLVKHV